MALPLTINGQVFEYPQNFDEGWGVDATGWAQAVTAGALYLSGGNFPLTAAVDFGSSFGIKVKSITSKTANPATSGYLLLAKADTIVFRNNNNDGNLILGIDGSNNLTFNGVPIGTTSLTDGHIYVGNASNAPVSVSLSGDATLTNTGVMTITNSAITNAKVSASAAIATSKLAPLTAFKAVVSDSGGLLSASSVTSTELGYLSGVTSAIQTQLGTLLPLAGGTMSGAISMASHKITSLTNGTAPGDAVAFNQVSGLISGLRVLQLVVSSSNTQATTTSTSYVDTNLTATIAPSSASSAIIILASGPLSNNQAGKSSYVGLFGTTNGDLQGSTKFLQEVTNLGNSSSPCTLIWRDSPGTTSAQTYKVRLKGGDGVSTASFGDTNSVQVMILVEIG